MSKESKDLTYEQTQELLRAPWKRGYLTRDFHYNGLHPAGERVTWKTYHNDTDYISVRLWGEISADGNSMYPIVEFTEVPELVRPAETDEDGNYL